MKAVCWCGRNKVRVETVPEAKILNPRDILIRVTATTICGSDLHLYDGMMAGMQAGDIIGHEAVGQVVAVGADVYQVLPGDRVAISPVIACGQCWFCKNLEHSLCDNSNPNAWMAEKMYNFSSAAVFGFTHLFGGYAGAQAEYLRVPFADVGALKIPDGVSDEQALACTDALPTGYMAAELCSIKPGDTIAVWGCGPVGQFAIRSAFLLGAARVIAIDSVAARLEMAERQGGATALDLTRTDIPEALKTMTGGRGPDACIDAVGMEAHGTNLLAAAYDRAKQALMLETDRTHVVRQMAECCRKGGTLSLIGAYALFGDKFPLGPIFIKGLRLQSGQLHAPRYIPRVLSAVQDSRIDPAYVFTHRFPLSAAPAAYDLFKHKREGCVKVVLRP